MKLIDKNEFDKLSNLEKRVAIAKDVIKRLKLQKLFELRGEFILKDCDEDEVYGTPQEFLNESYCEVCAKGALVCSWIGNFNRVSWGVMNHMSYNDVSNYPLELIEIFGQEMMDNLEAAFESESFDCHYSSDITDQYARAFNGRNSLKELMEHIIENKGEFPLP